MTWESIEVSPLASPPPQLIDTSVAPRLLPDRTALNRFALLLVAASTSTILAAGASACAHSMSSDSSSTHPPLTLGVPCGSPCSKPRPLWVIAAQVSRRREPYCPL